MRRLLPTPLDGDPDRALDDPALLHALAAAYAYPAGRPWVRANMVGSVDGAVTVAGRSGGLSTPGDRTVFHLLRGLADVVLVGAGTARAEGYGPASVRPEHAERRRTTGQSPQPRIALVSGRLDLDPSAPLFTAAAERTLVLTAASAPPGRHEALAEVADVVVVGDERVDARHAVDALVNRGLARILCEGGPSLLGALAAADRVDELCLTVSALLAGGDAGRIVRGPTLDPPRALRLAGVFEDGGTLFLRYQRDR